MVPAIGGNNMWGPRRTETKQKTDTPKTKTNKQDVEKEEAGVVQ